MTFQLVAVSARVAFIARMPLGDVIALLAHAALAARAFNRGSIAYRLHIGSMRSLYRKAR